jgi:zinc transport system ATP-binding protein
MDKPLLSLHDLYAGYEHETILQNINLEVVAQDFIGLIGPNGGGKSTLLKVILGLLPPQRGEVHVMGLPPSQGRRFIGYVPQFVDSDRHFPISVWETVSLGLLSGWNLFRRFTPHEKQRIEEALEMVEIADLRHKPMGELSGGQRQRVWIARALVSDPKLLLLDEPTASIDPTVTQDIYELLSRLNERMAILLITHDMMAISSYTKTIACLNRKLIYHNSKELTPEMLDSAYGCPVDLIAHGVPHRVFSSHEGHNHG